MERTDVVRSLFVVGLRDAHAVEQQALALMDRQIGQLEHYPELEQRLRQHRAETEQQVKRLDEILDDLGEDHSALKDTTMGITGNVMALAHTLASDEILKNSFANCAFENYEAAAYRSLITLTEAGNFSNARPLLEQTLKEEEAMAQFCCESVPMITRKYLERRSSDETAKR